MSEQRQVDAKHGSVIMVEVCVGAAVWDSSLIGNAPRTPPGEGLHVEARPGADAHGAAIQVGSTSGHGSIFTFQIDRQRQATGAARTARP
jgi:hypothetical protein